MSYRLRLFVSGRSSHSLRALRNLRGILDAELGGRYELEVVDVLEHPRLAESDRILVTPTLLRQAPEPVRKIIGDMSDRERVLMGLDLPLEPPEVGGDGGGAA